MKKHVEKTTNDARRLVLHRETLRRLSTTELTSIAGGHEEGPDPSDRQAVCRPSVALIASLNRA